MDRWERVLHLHRLISQSRTTNAVKLARELEVTPRTIGRDIEWMRNVLRAPIEYDPARRGYYYSESAFALPASILSRSQLAGLLLARQSLERDRQAPWYAAAMQAFERVLDGIPKPELHEHAWVEHVHFSESGWNAERKVWTNLCLCIEGAESACLTLRLPGGASGAGRLFDPYEIIVLGQSACVRGWDHSAQKIEQVRLADILSVDFPGQNFTVRKTIETPMQPSAAAC